VTLLERRIRERISSTESSRIGVHKAKRAGTDEWAWLDAYAAATAKKEGNSKVSVKRRVNISSPVTKDVCMAVLMLKYI